MRESIEENSIVKGIGIALYRDKSIRRVRGL